MMRNGMEGDVIVNSGWQSDDHTILSNPALNITRAWSICWKIERSLSCYNTELGRVPVC
jgi:hypothetical protein